MLVVVPVAVHLDLVDDVLVEVDDLDDLVLDQPSGPWLRRNCNLRDSGVLQVLEPCTNGGNYWKIVELHAIAPTCIIALALSYRAVI